jgi:hypothetical protein
MIKKAVEQQEIEFPSAKGRVEFEVIGNKQDEKFVVNISRKNINSQGASYQGRVSRSGEILMRLDVNPSGKHRNPDGEMIDGTHLHVYTEEHGMTMAVPFDVNNKDLFELCIVFFERFNIIEPPPFKTYQQSLDDIGEGV